MTKTSKTEKQKGARLNAVTAAKSRKKRKHPRNGRRLDSDSGKGFMTGKKKPAGETGWRLAF
jgi:hypothetical protein